MTDDRLKSNVVKLRQPSAKSTSVGVRVDDIVTPKSLLNMTPLEQQTFLTHLRERRLRAAAIIKEAHANKHRADSISAMAKLEKKAATATREYEKACKAMDRLESLLHDLRALHIQHTDIDITKVTDDDKHK